MRQGQLVAYIQSEWLSEEVLTVSDEVFDKFAL